MKILILFFIISINASCQQAGSNFSNISADSLKAMRSKSRGILLDVRTPGEYKEAHIPGAINIDYNDDGFAAALDTLDKNLQYEVYCRSGRRSGEAVEMMSKKGFKKIYHLKGGILEWNEKGYETVK